jgi:hypothetical protein
MVIKIDRLSIYKFPNFRYSPFLLSKSDLKIKLDLEDLGLEEDSDLDAFANKHLDKSFVFDYMYDHYDFLFDIKMMKHWNDKYLNAFPGSINARINYINIYDNEKGETTEIFKTVLAKEIDLFINENASNLILNDEDYNSLLYFLTNSFCEIGEVENAKKIFQYVLSFGNQNSIEELAFRINGEEFDDFMHFNYVSFLMIEKTKIFEWHEAMLTNLADKRKSLLPHKSSAYTILNKDTFHFSLSDITQLNEYDNDAVLYDDLIWVLYNGMARQFAGEDFFKEHYLFNAVIVAAHFKLSQILDDFLILLSEMPIDKDESLFGEFFENTFAPSLAVLGCENLDPVIKAYKVEDPRCKYFINIILAISQMNVIESNNASQFIAMTIEELLEFQDYELLNHWIFEIVVNGLTGYDWLIDQAINEGWIDTLLAEIIDNGAPQFDFFMGGQKNIEDVTIDVLLNCFREVHPIDNSLDTNLESIIDNIVLLTNERISDNDFIQVVEDDEFFIEDLEGIDLEDILGMQSDTFMRNQPKVGRNSPCPCGSGRKYKFCCLSDN